MNRWMEKLVFVLIILVLLVIACRKPATLLIDSTGLNDADSATRYFVVHNTSEYPVAILDFVTSCDCMLLDLQKPTSIPAHDSLVVIVSVRNIAAKREIERQYVTLKTDCKPSFYSINF